jgi:cytoskeletal protein CcmA (bactofilin family)
MNELKEIRIGESITTLKDNLVKTAVLPKTSAELDRDVTIQGNVRVEGAVFARNLIIDSGPAEFLGAVYAHNELYIKNDAAKTAGIMFNKAVASSGSVVALLLKGRCIYGADINAASVKLKNCFVAGSIFANEIQIENTVVLGGVFASKKLSLQNVVCGTFNAPEVAAGGVNYLLYPTSFSAEPVSPLPGTEFYNITLADLGSLYKAEPEKAGSGKIRMDIDADSQRTVLVEDDGGKLLLHSYSVAGRVLISDLLDTENFENHFLILSASLGSQILKTYSLQKTDGGKSDELTVPRIADFFFSIMSGATPIQDLSGSIPFDELRKRYL